MSSLHGANDVHATITVVNEFFLLGKKTILTVKVVNSYENYDVFVASVTTNFLVVVNPTYPFILQTIHFTLIIKKFSAC